MTAMTFKKWNNLAGWLSFAIAAVVYLCTIEPTASLWDCGEFIATSYKLEVGHPPGAPLFMLISRLFSLLALGNVTLVAAMINAMSALCSAFTILFLFWTITHFTRKIFYNKNENTASLIATLGAGFVGAMAYTFSDTFWFSAVEGEVYAMSSLFTAVVFWAMLKWEEEPDDKLKNRWIILIAYLMGLSVGVHLLNLLAIPAIGMIYYFQKYKFTWWGAFKALALSAIILLIILYGIIPGVVVVASWFELWFVNSMGLPYNSGALFFMVLLVVVVAWSIWFTYKKGKKVANTVLLCLAVILVGYSSFAVVVIRSAANPPIDENSPDNVFSLKSYLNREQYGDRPLFKGAHYATPITDYAEGSTYVKKNGRYEQVVNSISYVYDERYTMLLPRMYSTQQSHVEEYQKWGNVHGKKVILRNGRGEQESRMMPTFGENLHYFFTYQLGHMYLRYFMWNFAGRQNDIQGHGGVLHGNWISGITPLDNAMLGPQKNLPTYLAQNKARNKYYMLPLVLGLAGLFFQLKRSKKDFTVVGLLFFLTGIAIVMYLNQTPLQPRERDYAYAGSFYAFCIWVGLGTLAVIQGARAILLWRGWPKAGGGSGTQNDFHLRPAGTSASGGQPPLNVAIVVVSIALCTLLVPTVMAVQNWDDHNRSHRYVARDMAYNYLMSCEPNAILFTYGDNDTFPLWYVQEVEGIRTDVRIVNLSLLGTDWYIEQMRVSAYESAAVKMSLPPRCYELGMNEDMYVFDKITEAISLQQGLDFVASTDPQTKVRAGNNVTYSYLPSKRFTLAAEGKNLNLTLTKEHILKSDLAMLDIIANNLGKRPIYFSTLESSDGFGLNDYLQYEGFTYRLITEKTPADNALELGKIEPDTLYDRLMNTYHYGNIDHCNVLMDEHTDRVIRSIRLREMFTRTALSLCEKGEKEKAATLLHRCVEFMPTCNFSLNSSQPDDIFYIRFIEAFYVAGLTEEANAMVENFYDETRKNLLYLFGMPKRISQTLDYEKEVNMHFLQTLSTTCKAHNQAELSDKFFSELKTFYAMYNK